MAFFESVPPPPPPEPYVPPPAYPWQPPETMVPGSVGAEVVLLRTATVAVAVGSLRAYPNGFEFTVHMRWRRSGDDHADEDRGLVDPFERHGLFRTSGRTGQELRLGLLYADGRRGATTGGFRMPADEVAEGELLLQQGGSGGSSLRWDGDFWAHPLPPDGPVAFIASWLAEGVTEARAEVDGAAIRAAAARAVELWPDDAG